MKVKFKYGIQTYSGKIDEMVYGSFRNDNLCIGREFVYPKLTDNNHSLGSSMKNLAIVYHAISPTYAQDLKTYATKNGQENVPHTQMIPTCFSIFVKMMYNWGKSDPEHVDLATITVADIVALDAEVRTIKRAVAAGYLPRVTGFDALTAGIQ